MSLAILYTRSPSRSVVSVSLPSSEYKELEATTEPALLPSPSSSPKFVKQEGKSSSKLREEQVNQEKSIKKTDPLNICSESSFVSRTFSVNHQEETWYSPNQDSDLHLSELPYKATGNILNRSQSFFDILEDIKSIKSTSMTPIIHTISSSGTLRAILNNKDSNHENAFTIHKRSSLATPPHSLLFHTQGLYDFNQPSGRSQHHFYHHTEPGISELAPTKPSHPLLPQNPNLARDPKCIGEYQDDTQTCEHCQQQYDTSEGYLRIKVGDLIASRYHVQCVLGQGTFGTVLRCSDTSDPFSKNVAIKIIRNIPKYRRAARTEIQILECIHYKGHDTRGTTIHPSEYCIRMEFWFEYCHHICMVFPLYKMDIYKYLGRNNFTGLSLRDTQAIARQILSAVMYMHKLRLVHTDIKPENILLKDDTTKFNRVNNLVNNQVLLIDFGSAIHEDQYHGEIVSTRHYRAPEIILGLGWSFPCDMWSIGCVLFELFQGTQMFDTHDNLTHLAMMEMIIGPFPRWMIMHYEERLNSLYAQGHGGKSFFNNRCRVSFPGPDTPAVSLHSLNSISKISRLFPPQDSSPVGVLFDLIKKCLRIDPNERITAEEALRHPFLSINVEEF